MTAADPLDRREPRQLLAQPEAREMPAIPAAWRERALRGSHRFALTCRIFGDARHLRRLPCTGQRPRCHRAPENRPDRVQFTDQTRGDVCTAPSTRKTQSA